MQTLKRIYGASFIFSLSLALSAYVNSSFISEHIGANVVGVVYAIAAFGTLLSLEFLPNIIQKVGNRNIILTLILVNIICLTVLGINQGPLNTAIAFIIFNITNSLIWYCLDIFIEHFSSAKKVGSIRGFYLSITNFAWLFSPILAGIIVSKFGFGHLYTIISIFIVFVGIVLRFSLKKYHDSKYRNLSTIQAIKSLVHKPNLFRITIVNFILQFFYAWMVVYTPLYLHEVHGIPFSTIGIMFTIMLVPFVILQYPIGRLLDTIHHEREFMTLGILIMAGSTFMFGYSLFDGNIVLLTLMLFLTRCGASIVEVVSESYFFKHVTDSDAEIISLFRSTLPVAYLIAPLAATIILWYAPYNMLFVILGAIVLLAVFPLDSMSSTEK